MTWAFDIPGEIVCAAVCASRGEQYSMKASTSG